jgi:DNA-binding IclR family transcriptional regulator
MKRENSQTSQTLVRGLQLIEVIANGKTECSVRQLADELELPRSVVHRLLFTLEVAGYLVKNSPRSGYRLGLKLWWLGSTAIQELEIKDVARPLLQDVASETGELVNLAILDGKEVLYIDKIDSVHSVRAHIPIGGRAPAFCAATGKAILAYRSDDTIFKVASSLKRFTKKTITKSESFVRHLKEIRARGYSINLGEYHEETGGVAAPILSREGDAIAAVGITVPLSRLPRKNIPNYGALVAAAAADISQRLGQYFDYGNGPEQARIVL